MGKAIFFVGILVPILAVILLIYVDSDPYGKKRKNNQWESQGTLKFEVNELYPFEHHFIKLPWNGQEDALEVHYVDEGPRDGPVLLMLHGNPSWSFLYSKMIKKLRGRFRCIALDNPGFGLSMEPNVDLNYDYSPQSIAATFKAFIIKLDLQDVTPILQDWASPGGFQMLVDMPERFKYLIAGNAFAQPVDTMPRVFGFIMGSPLVVYISERYNFFLNFMLFMILKKPMTDSEDAMWRAPWDASNPNIERWTRGKEALMAGYISKEVPWLQRLHDSIMADSFPLRNIPTLFLWGALDEFLDQKALAILQRKFPNHTTVMLPEAGHFWQFEGAADASKALDEWYV